MRRGFYFLLIVLSVAIAKASDTRADAAASEIRKELPKDWRCSVITEKGKMGHPHGLEEPLFRLDFVNTKIELAPGSVISGENLPLHPKLRLHFHSKADRARILKTVKNEEIYSWDIPILFGETKEYVIVTSPLWLNGQSNSALEPLYGALRRYMNAHK